MPNQQQQLVTLLLLAGVAGFLLFITVQQPQPPPPPPPGEPPLEGPPEPPPVTEFPPLTPEEIAAHRGNGARTSMRAVPFYTNTERWELKRDKAGRLAEIVVHRDARVAQAG